MTVLQIIRGIAYSKWGVFMGVSHKGAISLGLLYIPVALYTTTRDNDIRFNQLCKDTKERVKYKKYCPSCNKEVKTEEIIKDQRLD